MFKETSFSWPLLWRLTAHMIEAVEALIDAFECIDFPFICTRLWWHRGTIEWNESCGGNNAVLRTVLNSIVHLAVQPICAEMDEPTRAYSSTYVMRYLQCQLHFLVGLLCLLMNNAKPTWNRWLLLWWLGHSGTMFDERWYRCIWLQLSRVSIWSLLLLYLRLRWFEEMDLGDAQVGRSRFEIAWKASSKMRTKNCSSESKEMKVTWAMAKCTQTRRVK